MSIFGDARNGNWEEREIGPLEQKIQNYLADRARDGEFYIKSKEIADDLDVSVKRVGPSVALLERDGSVLDIEPWNDRDSSRSVTWHVELREVGDD